MFSFNTTSSAIAYKDFFSDLAISKITEGYNSGEILKEGMSAWYQKA